MRILLVEDDAMIASAVQSALKDESYAADWVKNGHLALAALAAQHYDAVLLDLGLPGKDGLEGLSRIVKTIAERLGARLELADATQFPQGLKVRLIFESA